MERTFKIVVPAGLTGILVGAAYLLWQGANADKVLNSDDVIFGILGAALTLILVPLMVVVVREES